MLLVLVSLSILLISKKVEAQQPTLLAIDIGALNYKAATFNSKFLFDIVLDDQSSRKSENLIYYDNKTNERYLGSASYSMGLKSTQKLVTGIKTLMTNKRNKLFFQNGEPGQNLEYIPESSKLHIEGLQLETYYAMIVESCKNLAERKLPGKNYKIKEVVVSVPYHYSQLERTFIDKAIQIAGLKTLSLINEDSASFLNYLVNNKKSSEKEDTQEETVILLDTGYTQTTLTAAKIKGTSGLSILKRHHVEIGGINFDTCLYGIIMQKFNKKHGSVLKNFKVTDKLKLRLMKESTTIKHKLSANTDVRSSIEGFYGDIDFSYTISRTEFEEKCSEEMNQLKIFITEFVSNFDNSRSSQRTKLIPIGGNFRIPFINNIIDQITKENNILYNKNLNGDESIVMGSVYYAALLKKRIKTSYPISFNELTAYDTFVKISDAKNRATIYNETHIAYKNVAYPLNLYIDNMRSIPVIVEFGLDQYQNNELIIEGSQIVRSLRSLVFKARTVDLSDKLKLYKEKIADNHIKIEFSAMITNSQILSFGSAAKLHLNFTSKAKNITTNETQIEYYNYIVNIRIQKNDLVNRGVLGSKEIAEEKLKLQKINKVEEEKLKLESERNELESTLYSTDSQIELHETYMKQEEIDELRKLKDEYLQWYDDKSYSTVDYKEFKKKTTKMKAIIKRGSFRKSEYTNTPKLAEKLNKTLEEVKSYCSLVGDNKDQNQSLLSKPESKKAFQDFEELIKTCKDTVDSVESWFLTTSEKQKELNLNDDVILTSDELNKKTLKLKQQNKEVMDGFMKFTSEMYKATTKDKTQENNDTREFESNQTPNEKNDDNSKEVPLKEKSENTNKESIKEEDKDEL